MTSPPQHCALITGASRGIGRATALTFAQAGINLILVGRSAQELETVADLAKQFGVQVSAHCLDLADLPQVKSAIANLCDRHGPIDVLVNNAGMGYTNTLDETALGDWQRVIDVNLTSVLLCVQGALPTLRRCETSTIINISSIAASNAFPQWGCYSVSKAGLVALSKTLAVEERSQGVRVTLVTPGATNSSIWDTETVQADFDRSQMLAPETIAQSILHVALAPKGSVIEELVLTPSAGAL
ncbi:SDR family oxidoreductase [Prochlorothrix hollandica]|uniref:Short-chain dehydrogenase n=1 Tax=Prochlorothrix hollandica PCC 9006 = CALU 1027 TaxID=317619 RepID=A0A0M2PWF0_PROHO|nr:SDR family oxidoreductase [Prochlorothrix hollandica]KKI98988.1 short-chain dehydrogenase [Prochlorothrix hollandica PCC 9006 = CALU 1027]